jgi:hypothetical protein
MSYTSNDKYCLHNLQGLSKLRNEYLSKLSKLFVYNSWWKNNKSVLLVQPTVIVGLL